MAELDFDSKPESTVGASNNFILLHLRGIIVGDGKWESLGERNAIGW